MKTVKLRDFQRHLHKIIKECEDVRVVNQKGELLCIVQIHDGRASASQKKVAHSKTSIEVTVTPSIGDGRAEGSPMRGIVVKENGKSSIEVCLKCANRAPVYQGEMFDESGDWVTMKICEMCYKKFKPRNFKKI